MSDVDKESMNVLQAKKMIMAKTGMVATKARASSAIERQTKPKTMCKFRPEQCVVHFLRKAKESAFTYVGFTPLLVLVRLEKHNQGRAQQCSTLGRSCQIYAVYRSFQSEGDARSFESTMQQRMNSVSY